MSGRDLALLGGAHVHLPDHLRVAREAGWRIAVVHDRDVARRETLRRDLDAAPLTDLAALGDCGVRAAVICSETVHHAADIRAAIGADLPVFCEKPMTGDAGSAADCATLARQRGAPLHVNYFFRANGALQGLRERLRDGALGTVSEARFRFSHDGGHADWLALDGWMTDPARACYGGFVDEAVHMLDLIGWMLGPVREGRAVTGNALGWPLDDHGAAVLRLESGATAVVEAGWTDAAMRLEIDIIGDAGRAQVRDGLATITPRGASSPGFAQALAPLDSGDGLRPFLAMLDGGAPETLAPPEDAATVNRLIDAMGLRLP